MCCMLKVYDTLMKYIIEHSLVVYKAARVSPEGGLLFTLLVLIQRVTGCVCGL